MTKEEDSDGGRVLPAWHTYGPYVCMHGCTCECVLFESVSVCVCACNKGVECGKKRARGAQAGVEEGQNINEQV